MTTALTGRPIRGVSTLANHSGSVPSVRNSAARSRSRGPRKFLLAGVIAASTLAALPACSTNGSDVEANSPGGPSSSSDGTSKTQPDPAELQRNAEGALDEISSGEGLRVSNRSGSTIFLIFPDSSSARVRRGKTITVLKPCDARLPIRAERKDGTLIDELMGPCKSRDEWLVER